MTYEVDGFTVSESDFRIWSVYEGDRELGWFRSEDEALTFLERVVFG